MTPVVDEADFFRQWMQSREGKAIFVKAARNLSKRIQQDGIPLSLIGLPEHANYSEINDHILSALFFFTLEYRSKIQSRLLAPEANAALILVNSFLRHLIDRARASPQLDPWRYLYKRASDAFRDVPDIITETGQNETLFSLNEKGRKIGPLAPEDVSAIELPKEFDHVGQLAEVSKKEVLISLARWYWQQVSALFQGDAVCIELRHFIDWLGLFVPLKNTEPKSLEDIDPIPVSTADEYFDTELVRQWAGLFVKELSDKQQRAFYYARCLGLKQEEAAARMGMKTASAIKYHLDIIDDSIRSFAADRPWLSPDAGKEANETAQDYFLQNLCDHLKKKI